MLKKGMILAQVSQRSHERRFHTQVIYFKVALGGSEGPGEGRQGRDGVQHGCDFTHVLWGGSSRLLPQRTLEHKSNLKSAKPQGGELRSHTPTPPLSHWLEATQVPMSYCIRSAKVTGATRSKSTRKPGSATSDNSEVVHTPLLFPRWHQKLCHGGSERSPL